MMTRRNLLFRCSIIVNFVVVVYIGLTHRWLRGEAAEYAYDQPTPLRSPASVPPASASFFPSRGPSPQQDQMRTFILDKGVDSNEPPVAERAPGDEKSDRINVTNALNVSVGFLEDDVLSTNAFSADDTSLPPPTLDALRALLECRDRSFEPAIKQRGEFWVLYNFVRADHGSLACHETVTYTTHGDFTFLDNLAPLLEKWKNPISLAIHAPGTDFNNALNSIRYVRDCTNTDLIKMYTTFHIFFSTKHIPKQIPNVKKLLNEPFNCSLPVPYKVDSNNLYKNQKKLLYPVNVGRNIARESALTHFILASDIELYPSPYLAERFLNMIARNKPPLNNTNPRIFPLSIFEVESNQTVPSNKTELVDMLKRGSAIPFHKKVCPGCHNVPKSKEWITENETQFLDVFHIGKRTGAFVHWEPIFIGTNSDPLYDERLSWEGKSDKMTQGYALCVLDYDFMILNNAFLVHRPGIKTLIRDDKRARLSAKTNTLIKRVIFPELKVLYGTRKGCAV